MGFKKHLVILVVTLASIACVEDSVPSTATSLKDTIVSPPPDTKNDSMPSTPNSLKDTTVSPPPDNKTATAKDDVAKDCILISFELTVNANPYKILTDKSELNCNNQSATIPWGKASKIFFTFTTTTEAKDYKLAEIVLTIDDTDVNNVSKTVEQSKVSNYTSKVDLKVQKGMSYKCSVLDAIFTGLPGVIITNVQFEAFREKKTSKFSEPEICPKDANMPTISSLSEKEKKSDDKDKTDQDSVGLGAGGIVAISVVSILIVAIIAIVIWRKRNNLSIFNATTRG